MRFALLGDHPDGLDMARALAASGRHALIMYSGPAAGLDILARDGLQPRRVGDLEEALADPAVEAVIVAGGPSQRAGQLRALQSERHVLCVHPVEPSPDVGYEAAMLQGDVRRVLLPLLPEFLHPAYGRFADIANLQRGPAPDEVSAPTTQGRSKLPPLLEWERWSSEECLLDVEKEAHKPGVPGWDVLRLVGGEIAEVFAMALPEELEPGQPLMISGRFVHGGMWHTMLLPRQGGELSRLALVGRHGRTELLFPEGWPGPARLTYLDDQGQTRVEDWPALHPWTALVEAFDAALDDWRSHRQAPQPGVTEQTCITQGDGRLGWLDAIRALELDDAVRRSVYRRRASSLDFQEATEEASFKGAMTLVGCSLLWFSLLLLIFSAWFPWLGWLILPIFGAFLVMQFLRWVVPAEGSSSSEPEA